MKEDKKIKVTGFFSVRQYKKGVPRNEQAILAEGEQIAFIANIPQAAEPGEPLDIAEARPFGTPYELTKEDGTTVQKVRLKFKIGKYCEWYKPKPANTELDGKKYEAVIKYQHKEKKADNALAASGLWANAVAIREIKRSAFESDPFGGESNDDLENLRPQIDTAPQGQPGETESEGEGERKKGDLPF